jgi:hypothetical protein
MVHRAAAILRRVGVATAGLQGAAATADLLQEVGLLQEVVATADLPVALADLLQEVGLRAMADLPAAGSADLRRQASDLPAASRPAAR